MNTFVGLSFIEFGQRVDELQKLLRIASGFDAQQPEYDAVCRATQILLVGHLEGAIKDLVKSILDDLSMSVPFVDRPEVVKRTFTTYYLKSEKGGKYDATYQNRLLSVFSDNNVDLRVEPYLFEQNKNPSPFMIDVISKRFGIDNILSRFTKSDLEVAFEDQISELQTLKERLLSHLQSNLRDFPYTVSVVDFKIKDIDFQSKSSSLWTTYLDGILEKRHAIAHGSVLSNEVNHVEIEKNIDKMQVFLYGLYIVFCSEVVKKCQN